VPGDVVGDVHSFGLIWGLLWAVFTVWWMFSTAGSLQRLAAAQEQMLIHLQVEADISEEQEE
jgi:hypothetical protein